MLKEKIVCTINKMQVCLNKLKTQSIKECIYSYCKNFLKANSNYVNQIKLKLCKPNQTQIM